MYSGYHDECRIVLTGLPLYDISTVFLYMRFPYNIYIVHEEIKLRRIDFSNSTLTYLFPKYAQIIKRLRNIFIR